MKIALFTNAYRPIVSGVVNSVDLIRKGLLRYGHKPFIFAPEVPDYREEHAGVWRFHSMRLTKKVNFPIAIPISARIFQMIPKMGVDIIHCHHPFLLGDVGAFFAKQINVPLVYTFHTQLEQYAHYIPLPSEFVRWIAREHVASYANKCDCVICPSPSIRGLLDEYGIKCRIEVLQNAIDVRKYKNVSGADVREKLGLTSDNVVAIFTGRLSLEKNLSFLIKAFDKVHQKHPECRLLLLGDGPIENQLRQEVDEAGLSNYVIFIGRVPYRDMPKYYAASDIFVMTSTTEVKPLSVLEGMASGLPVVAVDACGTGDTVTDGSDGLLCQCDMEAYIRIWEKIVVDRTLRRKMSEQASITAEKYSLENYTNKLINLYRELKANKN